MSLVRLLRTAPSASASTSRAFHASAVSLGRTGMDKQGKKVAHAKKMRGERIRKGDRVKGPIRRIEPPNLIKLEHPLWATQDLLPDLPIYNSTQMTRKLIGTAMAYAPTGQKPPLQEMFGIPRNLEKQNLNVQQPFSVITERTMDLLDTLDKSSADGGKSQRIVITGAPGSGKSTLLMQAASYASSDGWIVFYVPSADKWVDSSTAYAYDYRSGNFHQNDLAAESLAQLHQFNRDKLANIKTQKEIVIFGARGASNIPAGSPLTAVCEAAKGMQGAASQLFLEVLNVLGLQTEIPVLLAIDDFQALYNPSQYRDPDFRTIQSYHLSMPRLIMEYASGRRSLARGTLLGAISMTNIQFPFTLELKETLQVPWTTSEQSSCYGRDPGPYAKRSQTMKMFTEGLQRFELPVGFSSGEAACLLKAWNERRILHAPFNDSYFLSKMIETSGNPRKLYREGVLRSQAM